MPYIYTPNGMVWVDEQPSAMDAPFWYGSYWGSQGIEGMPPEGGQYSNYDPLADIQAAQQYAKQGYPTYEQPMFDQYGNPTFSVDTNWAAPSETQGGAPYPSPAGMNATWLPGEAQAQQAGGGSPGVYHLPEPPVFHAQGTGVADIQEPPFVQTGSPTLTPAEQTPAPGPTPTFSVTKFERSRPVEPERSELPTRLTPGVVPPLPYEPAPMPNTVTPGPVPEVQKPKSKGDGTPFNIPIPTDDKGGGGAPMPVGNFPVVGGGPLMQSVFVPGIPQPIPIASLGQLIAGGLPYGR